MTQVYTDFLVDVALAVVIATALGWLAGAAFSIWTHNRKGGES